MKTRTLALILAALMALTALTLVPASAEKSGDWEYTVNEDGVTATVTKYTGSALQLSIPDKLDGYTVTQLSSSNWDGIFCNTPVKSVTIPDSVTTIGSNAFKNCTSIEYVFIPDSVTEIGYYAFSGCESLTSVNIPNGVTKLSSSLFSYCLKLENVTIPAGVTEIGSSVFNETAISSITLPAGLKEISSSLFLFCYSLGSIDIPYGVESIGSSAFEGCHSLSNVTIPATVTKIGSSAFYQTGLKSITIPASVTTIEYMAFDYCSELTTVYYGGTQESWYKMTIEEGNDPLINAKLEFVKLVIPGDVDGNGKLNAKDVTAIMKHLVGKTPENFVIEAADYDGNGKLNAKDVTALMKFLVNNG